MYHFNSALVREKGAGTLWETKDISGMTMQKIYTSFRGVFINLTNDYIDGEFYLDFFTLGVADTGLDKTLAQWLVDIGNRTLDTKEGEVTIDRKYTKYVDAYSAHYVPKMTSYKYHPDADVPLAQLNDLLLTRKNTNYEDLGNYVMASVNGIWHPTSGSAYGLYVLEGAKSGRLANDNHIGLLSWQGIGKIQTVQIGKDDIVAPVKDLKFSQSIYIYLKESMAGKTPILVFGGIIHVLDGSYTRLSDHVIKIDVKHIPLLDQYYLIRNRLDLSSLGLDLSEDSPDLISKTQFFSDDTIVKWVDLPQTFVVLVDAAGLEVQTQPLGETQLPGRWITGIEPKGLLITDKGMTPEYLVTQENGVWVLASGDFIRKNPFRYTDDFSKAGAVTDAMVTMRMFDPSPAKLLTLSYVNVS
jgi:hypothetical protein